jgi:Fe-S cluster biogenesis protein NfuA
MRPLEVQKQFKPKYSSEVNDMLENKPKPKILVDGGDPEETLRVKELIGFVDGQTTKACEPQKYRRGDKFVSI